MSLQIAKTLMATAILAVAGMTAMPAVAQRGMVPPPSQHTFTDNVMSFEQLEKRARAEVPFIHEIKVRDLLLQVKGYDNEGRKVKLTMDRRTGAVLSHEIKYDKHSRGYMRGPMGGR